MNECEPQYYEAFPEHQVFEKMLIYRLTRLNLVDRVPLIQESQNYLS